MAEKLVKPPSKPVPKNSLQRLVASGIKPTNSPSSNAPTTLTSSNGSAAEPHTPIPSWRTTVESSTPSAPPRKTKSTAPRPGNVAGSEERCGLVISAAYYCV